MKEQQISLMLAVLGLFFIAPNFIHACDEYAVSKQNLETMISEVNNCYNEDLESGIGIDSVASFLQSLLPNGTLNKQCAFPKASLGEITNTNLYFIWPKIAGVSSYAMACLNFTTGESAYQQLGQNRVKTSIVNTAVCLYAFYSFCNQTEQSIVKIIIVDKDIVGEATGSDIIPRLAAPKVLEENGIQLGPNPFDSALRLHLSLVKEASIKVSLLQGPIGIRQRQLLLETVQPAGRHELPIELPFLVPGWYYALLEVGEEREVIPLIKVGERIP